MSLLFSALLAGACSDDHNAEPTPARVNFGDAVTLSPGSSLVIDDVTLVFEGVESDSRCPSDVVCVRAGEAVVALVLTSGGTSQDVVIEIPPMGQSSQSVSGIIVTGTALAPEALSTREIAKADYRLTMVVTRP